jgi:FemAB-related protein (PEP-CTERM system-associated)
MRTMALATTDHQAVSRRSSEVVVSAGTATEWNAYVLRHPLGTVDHLWQWQTIFRDVFGHESEYVVARRGMDIVGVLPLVLFNSRLFGRSVVSLPVLNYGGLLTDSADIAGPLVAQAGDIARRFDASHVELRQQVRQTDLPARQHKVTVRMSLPERSQTLWDGLDRKVRNQVRKAQKGGFTVAWGGTDVMEDFYRVFAENMRDLGTPVYSRRLFACVLAQFPTQARICVVSHGGRPVAGGVTLTMNETVLVPWASSLKAYRHLCPNMLLYWSMLEAAIEGGARVFDFGRSSPDAGTLQFKLQWGATPTPQSWEYLLRGASHIPDHGPSNRRFTMAIESWKRLPLGVANRIGPAIVRHIP